MFTLEMLPAEHGDCLWLEYGDAADPHRVLIDGGPVDDDVYAALSGRLAEARDGDGSLDLELLVVTHIDADHIGGVLSLLADRSHGAGYADVWFNGWDHLPSDELGAKQAEQLSGAIIDQRLPWNAAFEGKAVVLPDDGPLPAIDLPGGLCLTLLSPTLEQLRRLRPVWEKEVRAAGMVPGVPPEPPQPQPDELGDDRLDLATLASERFRKDRSAANGASIAFLAEYEGASCLLAADGHADVLAAGLARLAAERGVSSVPVNVFKLPHHGSRKNLDNDLLGLVNCRRYAFSTSGKIFHHPDPVAVSRVVMSGGRDVELLFNYRSPDTQRWDSGPLRREHRFHTRYPDEGATGLVIDLTRPTPVRSEG